MCHSPIGIANDKLNALYERLVDEEDARVCKDISDDACRYVPVNFFTMIAANTLTKLGDELNNPKTVLAWLFTFVAAPVYLIGFLVPIRESGSMLPPLAFFVLGIAHSGVRLGRKTYVVDMAGGNKRTGYVAVSNTVIGLLLLATGFIGLLAAVIAPIGVILVLSLLGLTGAFLGTRLPEV